MSTVTSTQRATRSAARRYSTRSSARKSAYSLRGRDAALVGGGRRLNLDNAADSDDDDNDNEDTGNTQSQNLEVTETYTSVTRTVSTRRGSSAAAAAARPAIADTKEESESESESEDEKDEDTDGGASAGDGDESGGATSDDDEEEEEEQQQKATASASASSSSRTKLGVADIVRGLQGGEAAIKPAVHTPYVPEHVHNTRTRSKFKTGANWALMRGAVRGGSFKASPKPQEAAASEEEEDEEEVDTDASGSVATGSVASESGIESGAEDSGVDSSGPDSAADSDSEEEDVVASIVTPAVTTYTRNSTYSRNSTSAAASSTPTHRRLSYAKSPAPGASPMLIHITNRPETCCHKSVRLCGIILVPLFLFAMGLGLAYILMNMVPGTIWTSYVPPSERVAAGGVDACPCSTVDTLIANAKAASDEAFGLRIATLQNSLTKSLNDSQAELDALRASLATLQQQTDAVETAQGATASQLAEQTAKSDAAVAAMKERIKNLEDEVTALLKLQSDVGAVKGSVDSLTSGVSALNTQVTEFPSLYANKVWVESFVKQQVADAVKDAKSDAASAQEAATKAQEDAAAAQAMAHSVNATAHATSLAMNQTLSSLSANVQQQADTAQDAASSSPRHDPDLEALANKALDKATKAYSKAADAEEAVEAFGPRLDAAEAAAKNAAADAADAKAAADAQGETSKAAAEQAAAAAADAADAKKAADAAVAAADAATEAVQQIPEQVAAAPAHEGDFVDRDEVESLIDAAIDKFSADGIGLPDYAIASCGGSVVLEPGMTSATHVPPANWLDNTLSFVGLKQYRVQSPDDVIDPDIHIGKCWPMEGSKGRITVRTSQPVVPDAFTVDHAHHDLAQVLSSAPRQVEFWGYESMTAEPTKLASGTYDLDSAAATQTFKRNFNLDDETAYQLLQLRVLNNYGNPSYTAIYRFRVHGKPVHTPPPVKV